MNTHLKYELTVDIYAYNPKLILRRIRALKDLPSHGVKKGDLGGFVEFESNLSHDGDCWISGTAKVYENARVSGNAEVHGDAMVFGSALVFGNAEVHGRAKIYGEAHVFGSALIFGDAQVYGNAEVLGYTTLGGLRHVSESKRIPDTKEADSEKVVSPVDKDPILEALFAELVLEEDLKDVQERLVQLRKVISSFK